MKKINIAIDGPVASGKGTVTKIVAQKLGYKFLDTGAMYRAVAYYLDSKNISPQLFRPTDLERLNLSFNQNEEICINGVSIEKFIRTAEISDLSSLFSKNFDIREFLVRLQKNIVKEKGFVLEGRDATTIITPDAELKVYLTADLDIRAKRRQEDYQNQGIERELDKIVEGIKLRDERDTNNGKYSLQIVDDAVVIDNSYMEIDEQVNKIVSLAKQKMGFVEPKKEEKQKNEDEPEFVDDKEEEE